ncbi:MAG TPA: Calx-beta domain-containing protein, partial [Thermoanaerobaculia bacterium]|nr:Calx-beta domain-containing protein [Thermoanaerobaculia bacterium]
EYFIRQPERGVARVESAFTTIGKDAARWFEFDRGGHVTFFADRTGIHGTTADVFGMVSRALQAWSSVEGAKVNLRYGGATTLSKPFAVSDRLNGILWNDPYGEVSGTFDCASGGVLALGGVRRAAGSKSFANGSAAEVIEADIVVNDGAACFFERNNGLDGEEVLAHELGHTLGFGHSKDRAALMHASAKGDGRGGQLGVDDIKGLFYLYPGAPGVTVEPGQLTLELGNYAGAEGETVQISVHRVVGSTGAASVRIRTRNGTAKAPADFAALDQTLTWAHGEAGPKTVTIGLAVDKLKEPAEKFKVELLSYAGATAGAIQAAEVTITDGKSAQPASGGGNVVSLQGASSTVRETDGWVNLTVERTGSGKGPATVVWRTVDAAAKAGKDYVGGRGVVRWANGDVAPKQVRVRILDIRAAGPDRAFLVRLLRTTGDVQIGAVGATAVKILDVGAR